MTLKLDWAEINAEWELSKLPQEVFCQSKQISYSTFVYHRCKLLEKCKQSKKSKFAAVCVKQQTPPSVRDELTLYFPNGIRLSIPTNYNATQVKQVFAILGINAC